LNKRYRVRSFVTSKSDDKNEVFSLIMNNIQTPMMIKLKTEEIEKYFDIEGDDFEVINVIEDLKNSLKEMTNYLMGCSSDYTNDQAKNDFFYFSQIAIKDYCLKLSQDFSNHFGYDYFDTSTKQYQHYLALQNAFRSVVESYRSFAAAEMDDVMFSNTGNYPDTKDYRKCPHCGLIWYRVSACPNVTCGNIEKEKDIISCFKSFFNFKFEWKKGEKPIIVWTRQNKVYNFTNIENKNCKPLGCGKQFNWLGQNPENMSWFFPNESSDIDVFNENVKKEGKKELEEERENVSINVISD